jgi:ubiquinone/menaquinone biosynthesis C-methylase UbiE
MKRSSPDYDRIAAVYDSRYAHNALDNVAAALSRLARRVPAPRILEAGCGTGRWIESLRPLCSLIVGADASTGMLRRAKARLGDAGLVCAVANRLPFRGTQFDLIYCVNALHHFEDQRGFVHDAVALLKPGGAFALIGIDPRTQCSRYLYEYFEGTLEMDLARYPSFDQQMGWMAEVALAGVELQVVDRYAASYPGSAVLDDPFLEKDSNSMLALLSDEAYSSGLRRIRAAIEQAESVGEPILFRSEIAFGMVVGHRLPGT